MKVGEKLNSAIMSVFKLHAMGARTTGTGLKEGQ